MRWVALIVVALSGVLVGAGGASASDTGPVIVVPGRHGLPVIIDGVDVSGAILEGEYGLDKPNMITPPRIISAPFWRPGHTYLEEGYFPATGHEPGYGRYEVIPPPNRRLPPPAPSFHRSWSSASDPLPATLDPTPTAPMVISPEVYPQWPPRRGHRPPEHQPKPPGVSGP
jgi:hypothetical protein